MHVRQELLEPDGASPKAYVLLHRALESTDRTAIVIALRQKTRLAALRVRGDVCCRRCCGVTRCARPFPALDETVRISSKELELSWSLGVDSSAWTSRPRRVRRRVPEGTASAHRAQARQGDTTRRRSARFPRRRRAAARSSTSWTLRQQRRRRAPRRSPRAPTASKKKLDGDGLIKGGSRRRRPRRTGGISGKACTGMRLVLGCSPEAEGAVDPRSAHRGDPRRRGRVVVRLRHVEPYSSPSYTWLQIHRRSGPRPRVRGACTRRGPRHAAASTDVWIADRSNAHPLAVGVDDAGRRSIYHPTGRAPATP